MQLTAHLVSLFSLLLSSMGCRSTNLDDNASVPSAFLSHGDHGCDIGHILDVALGVLGVLVFVLDWIDSSRRWRLFHGTSEAACLEICAKNFALKLAGTGASWKPEGASIDAQLQLCDARCAGSARACFSYF